MRLPWQSLVVLLSAFSPVLAQTPPVADARMNVAEPMSLESSLGIGTAGSGPHAGMTAMVKKSIQKAIDRNGSTVAQWHPLTPRQKFQVFVSHTYAPRTFANAAMDAAMDRIENHNSQYAAGFAGAAQRFGVELTKSETNVFFGRFLIPALLRQDPRYFRNPNLPLVRRVLYSMTRVLITRSDTGHAVFNASYVVGGAAAQALNDLYVPGHRQGMLPIEDRLTFALAIDSGFNLVHEFWPDVRRRLLHR